MMEPKKRKRVPVSCLNCRRRRVKCDKEKPACGGCVRTGVPHLCEYLQPHWTSDLVKNLGNDHVMLEKILEVSELRQMKITQDRIIANQRKEIEDLKRQLLFNYQLSTDQNVADEDTRNSPVKVLVKLNPLKETLKDVMQVEDNGVYSVDLQKSLMVKSTRPKNIRDIYSWISIVILDPKLSNLWQKINSMQKIYYMYKSSVKEKLSSKITEIDFTSPGPIARFGKDLKCPVVLCDLNFMNDTKVNKFVTTALKRTGSPSSLDEFSNQTDLGVYLMKLFRDLWHTLVNSPRGNQLLTMTQLNFLLDFYFNETLVETSRYLTYLYKNELTNLYYENDGKLCLKINEENESLDLSKFSVKGAYICMLVLIVDETLDVLRTSKHLPNDLRMNYESHFPNELLIPELQYNGNLPLNQVHKYLDFAFVHGNNGNLFNRTLPSIACGFLLLNRDIANSGREGNERDETIITKLWKLLLSLILDDENPIDIWKNPGQIQVPGNDSKMKVKDVRLHVCLLWNEMIRCLNIMSYALVSSIKTDRELQRLIQRASYRVEEVQMDGNHFKYLQNLKTPQLERLSISLQLNYILANLNIFLNRGVSNLLGVKLTIKDLDDLIAECGSWLEDQRLERLPKVAEMEFKIMLHISNIYTTYIMFLQFEENKVEALKENLITAVILKFNSFIKLSNTILDLPVDNQSQYLYNALSGTFVLVVQILLAVLLRVCQRPHEKNESLVKQLSTFYYSMSKSLLRSDSNIFMLIRSEMTNSIVSTLQRLKNSISANKIQPAKLQQLWLFYLSFLEGNKKFDSNYKQVHAHVSGFNKFIETDDGKLSEFKKCPVSHMHEGCPIDHSSTRAGSPYYKSPDGYPTASPQAEGKCPVAHLPALSQEPWQTVTRTTTTTTTMGRPTMPSGMGRSASIGRSSASRCPVDHSQMEDRKLLYQSPGPEINMAASPFGAPDLAANNHREYDELVNGVEFGMKNFSNIDLDFLSDPSVFEAFDPQDLYSMPDMQFQ